MSMSRILELLKNAKVEWKRLGEVCDVLKGEQFNKRDMLEMGSYPVINGGVLPSGYVEIFNSEKNTITISQGGASAGFVNFIDRKFWLGAHAFSIIPYQEIIKQYNYDYHTFNRFLFHVLKLNQEKLQKSKIGAGIPNLSKETVLNINIPMLSKELTSEIARILDEFSTFTTDLTQALSKELELRKKQYRYYLEKLLSEEYLKGCSEKLEEEGDRNLRVMTLGEIGKFIRGNGLQKKDFRERGRPVIHYGQIHTTYSFSTKTTVSYVEEKIFSKLKKAQQNDILIATTSENIKDVAKCVVWLGDEEIGFSGDMYVYRTEENAKYVAYYFQSDEFQKQKDKKVSGTNIKRIHSDDMAKFIIPLPPLSIQEKVVKVLDKFQELVQNVNGLLPQEIEMRKKQYEYYRERLLSFDRT